MATYGNEKSTIYFDDFPLSFILFYCMGDFPALFDDTGRSFSIFSSCRSDTSLNWSSGSNTRQPTRMTRWWRGPKNSPKIMVGRRESSGIIDFDEHANGSEDAQPIRSQMSEILVDCIFDICHGAGESAAEITAELLAIQPSYSNPSVADNVLQHVATHELRRSKPIWAQQSALCLLEDKDII